MTSLRVGPVMFCANLSKCLLLSFHHSLESTAVFNCVFAGVQHAQGLSSPRLVGALTHFLRQIKRWLTEEVAENKSLLSQRGAEAGGSSTIQSSVEQKPSEACRSQQMQFCWWFCAKREAVSWRQNPRCANSETAVVRSAARCSVYTLQCDRIGGLQSWI